MQLCKLSFKLADLVVESLDLLLSLLSQILSLGQLMNDYLVLVIFVFELKHVVSSLVLALFCLFHDAETVDVLPDLSLLDLHPVLLNLVVDFVQVLLQLCVISGILLECIEALFKFIHLAFKCLVVIVDFFYLSVKQCVVVLIVVGQLLGAERGGFGLEMVASGRLLHDHPVHLAAQNFQSIA